MGDYRSLRVWQVAHELALDAYCVSDRFPDRERYELTSQVRRAAFSIAANVAEGAGRNSPRELARYCRISSGSASELDYAFLLSRDLGYLTAEDYDRLHDRVDHVRRMLANLVRALARKSTPPPK